MECKHGRELDTCTTCNGKDRWVTIAIPVPFIAKYDGYCYGQDCEVPIYQGDEIYESYGKYYHAGCQ